MESSIEFEFHNQLISKEVFSKICRTCLSLSETTLMSEVVYNSVKLGEILKDLVSIQVEQDDDMPKCICMSCIHLLIQLYTFKQKVHSYDVLLRTVLIDENIKEEDDLNIDLCAEEIVTPFDTEKIEVSTVNVENELHIDSCSDVVVIPIDMERSEELAVNSKERIPSFHYCKSCNKQKIDVSTVNVENELHIDSCSDVVVIPIDMERSEELAVNSKERIPSFHYCKSCNKQFNSLLSLRLHTSTIKRDNVNIKLCAEKVIVPLDTENSLKPEFQVYKLSNSSLEAVIKPLDEERLAEPTRKVEIKEKLHYCRPCKKEFDSISELNLHKKQLHLRNHVCTECGKAFSHSHLVQHMRIHTKEKPFRCGICFKRFNVNGNLRRHILIHTGEKRYKCNLCDKDFSRSEKLNDHKRTHTGETPFMCSYCGLCFSNSAHYRNHLYLHKRDEITAAVANKEVFKCNVCDRSYTTKTKLKQHMLIHGEKAFLCSECGKRFRNKQALIIHSRVHTGDKPYSCGICGKSFSNSLSQKCHIFIHTGEKPFVCKVCSKAFRHSTNLERHTKIHSGKKPHSCPYCGKPFRLKTTLKVHVRMHTGEMPYICDTCHRGFYDRSGLKKHTRVHEKAEGN